MKAVIATGIFPPDVGGPATFVPTLASDWTRRGWDVAVVTYADTPKGPAYPYEVRRAWRFHSALLRYAVYLRHVWQASEGASVVFAQDPVAAGLPAWIVSWLRRKRFVLKIVGDFAWEHARVQEGYEKSLEEFQNQSGLSLRIRLMRTIERFVARRADRVIVPSKYLAGIAKTWGVQTERTEVIYNGVEPLVVKPQTSNVKRHAIVTAGRLVPWKGMDTLIAALAKVRERMPDATLTIIGDGPDGERLRKLAHEHHLEDAVTFTGRLSRAELSQHIAESGVFALVSSYEGFSHQLVEAFQLGAAVVASDAGGNPEIVTDGENGLLVKYGDVGAISTALLRFLEDAAFAARCGEMAKRRASDFTVEKQMKRIAEVVRGTDEARILMISRDASLHDANSRGAARMRMYRERVDDLSIVTISKKSLPPIWKAIKEARASGATLITAQDPFEAGLVAHIVSWWLKIPFVVEEHGGVYLGSYWKNESAKNRSLYQLGKGVMAHAYGIRAVSAKIESDMRMRYPKKPIVRLPVYTEPLACVTSEKRFDFGYIGRFVPQKNLPMLIEAFRRVLKDAPSATLTFVGAGELHDELRTLVAETGIADRVAWQPFQEDVSGAYAAIRTLVLPSWYEGWGRVVVEAMHCGVPVVMTDVGAAGEVVRDGVEGRVTPIGDVEAFAAAMRETLDPARHEAMVRAAKLRMTSVETPAMLANRMAAFWRMIIGL